MKLGKWKKRGFEFLSIFIAVVSAFALNNWNENRRDSNSESKILIEIANGIKKDLEDIKSNVKGHNSGIRACRFFRNLLMAQQDSADSLIIHYHHLTRDYVSIQNTAGYETLKSKGLELVQNDSLRLEIIALYEYDYNTLRKLEEEYAEMQFQESYFLEINKVLAPSFTFDTLGMVTGLDLPLDLKDKERKALLLYLWKIQGNRQFILYFYEEIEKKILAVKESIRAEID